MKDKICKICGHSKDEHKSHIAPDHTGQKINHVGCRVVIKRSEIDMHEFGISSIGHTCSCDGFKPNTKLKRAIKKYQKYLKELERTSDNIYKRQEIKRVINRFKKSIKENPKNLLHWQLEQEVIK